MTSRNLLNLILLALVIGLGALVYFDPGDVPPPEAALITAVSPADVKRVWIEGEDRPRVELEKTNAKWRLVAPLKLPASAARASRLTEVAAAVSHRRFGRDDRELDKFGLAPPRGVLRLDDVTIAFGDTEPLSGRRYVLADDTVHLITDRYYHLLAATAASYVEPTLLGRDARPVELTLPDRRLRRLDGAWTTQPPEPDMSADALARLIDAWKGAQAIAVKAYDPTLTVDGRVTLRLEGAEQSMSFGIAHREREIIFGRPELGIQYHLTQAVGEKLLGLDPAANEAESR